MNTSSRVRSGLTSCTSRRAPTVGAILCLSQTQPNYETSLEPDDYSTVGGYVKTFLTRQENGDAAEPFDSNGSTAAHDICASCGTAAAWTKLEEQKDCPPGGASGTVCPAKQSATVLPRTLGRDL